MGKPRVNETFQVDFGSTASWQSLLSKLSTFLPQDTILDSQLFSRLFQPAEHLAEDTLQQLQSAVHQLEAARKAAIDQAASAGEGLTGVAKSLSLEAAKRSAIMAKEAGIQLAELRGMISKKFDSAQDIREPLDEGLIKAQIQSKLLWLKLQGKDAEYQEYQRRASIMTRGKPEKSRKAQKAAAAGRRGLTGWHTKLLRRLLARQQRRHEREPRAFEFLFFGVVGAYQQASFLF